MKYTFSFQKVLDVKEKEQEMAHQDYGAVKLRLMEVDQQMEQLMVEKEEMFEQYNHVHQKSVSEILEMQEEMEHVNQKLKQLTDLSLKIHQEADRKQQVLIEKSQEAKMWNTWKDKSKQAWQKQIELQEQAMLDEMAVLRYSRR
ncbi:flagellar export protein FliJ [Neobacillus muris]|uniref:flagellar export protein FliJ n=1 Tax=Neobacillus muris TaxID=2941334 RepID=UPI00203D803A|nr:flagellar export protein FliJ [Neobacillus muris]